LDRIYADALTIPGLRQASISLGLREDLVSQDETGAEHAQFSKLAAIGVAVFVSSGDQGSDPQQFGSSGIQVEYEASDSSAVAVGGTTLALDPATGKVTSETAWANSGGGISTRFERPAWQDKFKDILASKRGVPDVSCVADPNPGAFVWLNGKELSRSGTSWSAPVWAGFLALISEAREKRGKKPLGFLAPALYRVSDTAAFRDITVGNNGAYKADKRWDAVTGLGVPNLRELIAALP